eukprot:765670-Hanusia_phi.AAC.1
MRFSRERVEMRGKEGGGGERRGEERRGEDRGRGYNEGAGEKMRIKSRMMQEDMNFIKEMKEDFLSTSFAEQ